MRVSSFPPHSVPHALPREQSVHSFAPSPHQPPAFLPFGAQAFIQARARRVPVFLVIGDLDAALCEPSLALHLRERTVPVHLPVGARPDVELLCQRCGALFSGEGALPLCALLLEDGQPFLAAPMPPHSYPLDPARLCVWLSHADRRLAQNPAALGEQAAQVIRSFGADPLRRPYAPTDAAHDLLRALSGAEDKTHGGFGRIKSPLVCFLRFLQHAAQRGDQQAHAMLTRALDAMLSSSIYDPLDGAFFRAALTDDWRAFVPEKPLAVNAAMALVLLSGGRRNEAVRLLDFIAEQYPIDGGLLSPALRAPKETYAFTPEQACAALGSEAGLRACRLLGLLSQHARPSPSVAPSRFSPYPEHAPTDDGERRPVRYPVLSSSAAPEDSAFLRRALPLLHRARSARTPQQPRLPVITEHAALSAAMLAQCGQKLGEARYIQCAQRAVSRLISLSPAGGPFPLPASVSPANPLHAQATCGAGAALALALLTLGSGEDMQDYAQSGLRLLGQALHAFVRPDGLVMHTPKDSAAFFPRVPAIYDGELPSPAALLVHTLRIADTLRPQAHYTDAITTIWEAAAPAVHHQPLACASLIDAMQDQ